MTTASEKCPVDGRYHSWPVWTWDIRTNTYTCEKCGQSRVKS